MTGQKLIIIAVVFAAMVFGAWLGCNKDDNSNTPTTQPIVAPTNLRAYSAGPTSVGLLWNLSTSESDASFNNYLVTVKDPSGTVVGVSSVAKGTPNVTVNSLSEGVIYTFVVRSTAAAGVVSSDSQSVRWSPARRYTTDSANGAPIQLYEFRSTLGASGLQFNSNGSYAKVRSLSTIINPDPDRFLCDIYVDSINGGAIRLKNIALLGYPRITFFSTEGLRDAADNLNDPRPAPPDTNSYQSNTVDIPSTTVTYSKIAYARSATDHKYVRILIQRNPSSGLLYYGLGNDRYVVLQLSYQNTAGNWFARPGYVSHRPQQ